MESSNKIFWLNIFAFFISLHYAIITYSASSFLGGVFGENNVWFFYTSAALTTIILNLLITNFLKKRNILKIIKIALVVSFLNLLNLASSGTHLFIFFSFVIYATLAEFIFLLSSIVLEDLSKEQTTGGTRGQYLAVQNIGFLIAPFLGSFFVKIFSINSLFVLSSIFIFIAFLILTNTLKSVPKIETKNGNVFKTLGKIFRNIDLRNTIFAYICLHLFYSAAIIYLPFKLENLGISLTQYLGVLMPVALFPFIFVPEILGYVEDKMKDEKEFLILGFFGLILILSAFAFIDSPSLFVWAIILFFSRIFASTVETSINSYFFKKIDKNDTDIISIFASSYNFANLAFVPIFALIIKYTDLKTLFLSVSFFLCFMLVLVSKIHDTKNYEKHKEWKTIWTKSKKRAL